MLLNLKFLVGFMKLIDGTSIGFGAIIDLCLMTSVSTESRKAALSNVHIKIEFL